MKSLKSETNDGLSSCSNFPERPTLDELELDKLVLPEIENLRSKVTNEQLEGIKDVLDRWTNMALCQTQTRLKQY